MKEFRTPQEVSVFKNGQKKIPAVSKEKREKHKADKGFPKAFIPVLDDRNICNEGAEQKHESMIWKNMTDHTFCREEKKNDEGANGIARKAREQHDRD